MPAPSSSNIWVAAGDGDLARVQALIDTDGLSPNAYDEHSYTPMHAAASYGHVPVLEFLLSRGGDVNIVDSDGDSPLYTVEDVDTARWLVDHGATIDMRNAEGISPIEHLTEEFPAVAAYLRTRVPLSSAGGSDPHHVPPAALVPQPSQHAQEQASEQLADALVAAVADIMRTAEAEGREPDEDALRRAVGATVLEGMRAGFLSSAPPEDDEHDRREGGGDGGPGGAKRARTG